MPSHFTFVRFAIASLITVVTAAACSAEPLVSEEELEGSSAPVVGALAMRSSLTTSGFTVGEGKFELTATRPIR